MQFTKLKLTGFKSFVDATELWIEPGLTGVVGPNGCGKSNLVEALRWVMGETSAKQMRGGGMDDVIFGGTDRRPSRNIAEVALSIDNLQRDAPAQYNTSDEIEVTRRIERGDGSNYQVNGTDVRARDIQTLFADAASGARSTALVSQGRIGAIIAAKPIDRRNLLEEAAGITGLHSRRHEAELRLRAAEINLERLDDLLSTLEEQLKGLNKQARQANRYKNISDHIRRAEAIAIHHQWVETTAEKEIAVQQLAKAEDAVQTLTQEVANATAADAEAANAIPALRENEAQKAAVLQGFVIAQNQLGEEEHRIDSERKELLSRISQITDDCERETRQKEEAEIAIARLTNEVADIEEAKFNQEKEITNAHEELKAANAEVGRLEKITNEILQSLAADESRQDTLKRLLDEFNARQGRIKERLDELSNERKAAEGIIKGNDTKPEFTSKTEDLRKNLEQTILGVDKSEQIRSESLIAENIARSELQDSEAKQKKLKAEEEALRELLIVGDPNLWPPMIDSLNVDTGYELALAAALGDDLNAPTDEEAPIHWRALNPLSSMTSLPDGAQPLSSVVRAPAQLARRLSQIGIVEDEKLGNQLAAKLTQGQRLVSCDGGLWRWDGYTIKGGAGKSSAIRLTRRNRLKDLSFEINKANHELNQAKLKFEKSLSISKQAIAAEKDTREELRSVEHAYHEARELEASNDRVISEARLRIISTKENTEALRTDSAEIEAAIKEANQDLISLKNIGDRRKSAADMRAQLNQARTWALEQQSNYDRLIGEAGSRKQRLADMVESKDSWVRRADNAEDQLYALSERMNSTESALQKVTLKPEEIEKKRADLHRKITDADKARTEAANELSKGELKLTTTSKFLREVEASLGKEREERVRCESVKDQIDQVILLIVERANERIKCGPANALKEVGVANDEKLLSRDRIEVRVERLKRERENMGAVNLRAEYEANELSERIQVMVAEREDLVSAIARLRQGIASLNREGRTRLLAAFDEVNSHFTSLFTNLFGGGKAYLTLTEAEDPLEAGLEIMASPPGKKMQTLSLLSGGEQALTAIALLFAVFLTNPAPICVLDEVDAPLDDANVERFCQLIQEISDQTNTRFMLVTHHRLTMARMDRLFGVTMSERGVSQLVSVDLQAAEQLRDSA